ncbi:MAG TPA: hypothetical protein VF590_14015, partial [Isosphaeraceae bacterium]
MSRDRDLEDRLESLGAELRSRPGVTDRVMEEVRRSVADGPARARSTSPGASMPAPRAMLRGRRRLLATAAGTVGAIAAVLLVAITMLPSSSVAWADVTQAIRAQEWIRGTVTFANGEDGTMWLSPG